MPSVDKQPGEEGASGSSSRSGGSDSTEVPSPHLNINPDHRTENQASSSPTATAANVQQGLGKGLPEHPPSSTTTTARPGPSRSSHSPSRASVLSMGEDTPTPNTLSPAFRPRLTLHQSNLMTPGATSNSGDQTPRMSGSMRGVPASGSFGGNIPGSPAWGYETNSVPRPSRTMRNNTSTGMPSSYNFNTSNSGHGQAGSGSMSRSASRARPALSAQNSTAALTGTFRLSKDAEDEEDIEDRGQALIKQRQKERKQIRKAKEKEKERERRLAENDGVVDSSAPPTGQPDESFNAQQSRQPIGQQQYGPPPKTARSVSRARTASATRSVRQQASESYFSSSGTATPRDGGLSPHEYRRPASIYSSTADDDEDTAGLEQSTILDEVVQEVVDEETIGHDDEDDEDDDDEEELSGEGDDEGVTLRDRQDAINIEHPFGLPIWKPALYRKSRSVTRNAESALHNIPSAAAERHLLPGNLLWVLLFGWWLAITCFIVAVLVSGAEVLGGGRGGYGKTLRGLAWYIGWPFGKYVEGEGAPEEDEENDGEAHGEAGNGLDSGSNGYGALDGSPIRGKGHVSRQPSDGASSGMTIRDRRRSIGDSNTIPDEPISIAEPLESAATIRERREPTVSFATTVKDAAHDSLQGQNGERAPLLGNKSSPGAFRRPRNKKAKMLGRLVYWPGFILIVAPLMLFVCVLCWGFVITIPMAKLTWKLLNLLAFRPLEINFRAAPKISVMTPHGSPGGSADESGDTTLAGSGTSSSPGGGFTIKRARLTAGQVAPTSGPKSTVLLCTYRAVGLQYYKYTVGGVNIMFINLMPLVFFTIIDGMLILPAVERAHHAGRTVSPFFTLVTSQALIFVLGLASVIPLSYFIGMAVASISAQSSIGMGAVINATFGSIIEIILYSIALTQGKGRLVEGSIVGSILAGVLLMPGASMCSGALKRKEQKFNAKSAGVTSTMLIMAIIGTLTPTMFYQTYGTFELHCSGCPEPDNGSHRSHGNRTITPSDAWQCNNCYYEHPDPVSDPFYQDQVKTLMYACAGILLFSYLIGLWFSLKTHAAQIWQNPQQLMKAEEHPAAAAGLHPSVRSALHQRVTPQAVMQHILPLHKDQTDAPGKDTKTDPATSANSPVMTSQASTLRLPGSAGPKTAPILRESHSKSSDQPQDYSRSTSGQYNLPAGYTPFLESVDRDISTANHLTPMKLPGTLTTEDFTRAVAVATVSALRHQGSIISSHQSSAKKDRTAQHNPLATATGPATHLAPPGAHAKEGDDDEEGGGHDAPSWTRGFSAGVLLACTLLYALIAEILVDVVDVVLDGSGIDEKFLGLTLFALVPNTTEFMNAMSFALNGNIALSMEIGSAYALQVCLLQIPAMVAFSALYDPGKMGELVDTFTLIFPRWDVIAIILSIFLLTYTYIEARSNYHRGSILVLAYIVLIMGFYYAPTKGLGDDSIDLLTWPSETGTEDIRSAWSVVATKLWA